ncbi:dynein beta chain, ciliary-like isoform X2 [Stegodyphus dumicola]|uniref:dynein beta chain, ciliary-like isoform X2 n=1 Tax=Stegodyphus dumicola TaxID=202533 RepID=UPI0015AAB3F7|nr:dynein beta chain, ciliary-like isoform X2 [Stegodyphus dumicola]
MEVISQDTDLMNLEHLINERIQSGARKALVEVQSFQNYADLWLQNIEVVLEDFVLYGPVKEILNEDEEGDESSLVPHEIKPPTEEEFKSEIAQFDLLQRKVDDINPDIQIDLWLALDVTPFKESLLVIIRNWRSAYKKKLVELKSLGKLRKLEDDSDL